MHVIAEIQTLDTATGVRSAVRVASSHDTALTGFAGQIWIPAIHGLGPLEVELFDGDFSSAVSASQTSLTLAAQTLIDMLPGAMTRRWQDAPIKIWVQTGEEPALRFDGTVTRFERSGAFVKLTAQPGGEAGETEVLNLTYGGTTGLEGDADLKGRLKPWLLGKCLNVEPVLINTVDNVYQISAYGPIKSVTPVYERAAGMGASFGDYADYAALVAADIPNGRWATCLAQGLLRFGAPVFGVATVDAEGDFTGGAYVDLTGAILRRVAAVRGVSADTIDGDSLDALDAFAASLPAGGKVGIFITEQIRFIELARRMCLPLNAQAGYSLLGKLQASRVAPPTTGTAAFRLDALGRELPAVSEMLEADTLPPYKKIIIGGARCWRVHTFDEIATQYNLVDKGRYSATETYREGNIVSMPDESRWLYEAETATAGNTPATGSAYWSLLSGAVSLEAIGGITTNRDPVPPESMPIGSLYIDPDNRQYRFEGVEMSGPGGALISGPDGTALGPGFVDAESQALARAEYQVDIIPPLNQTVFTDFLGEALSNQFPRVLTPSVKLGTDDIRTANHVTYAMTTSGTVSASINTIPGDPDKGRITVTSAGTGYLLLTVTINGRDYGPYKVQFSTAAAPPASAGGPGSKRAEDTTFPVLTSASLVEAAGPLTVTVATGEDIICAFPASYSATGPGNLAVHVSGKWQHSPAGAGTWTDAPAGLIDGTDSTWLASLYSGEPGEGAFNDTITGLSAGDYDLRFMAKLSNTTNSPSVEIFSSTATVLVQ